MLGQKSERFVAARAADAVAAGHAARRAPSRSSPHRRREDRRSPRHTRQKPTGRKPLPEHAAARRRRGAARRGAARRARRLRAHRRGRERDRRAAAGARSSWCACTGRSSCPRGAIGIGRDQGLTGAARWSCRSRAASPARAARRHASCGAGRTTCRSTGSSRSTPAKGSSWRARPSAAGTPSWPTLVRAAHRGDVAGRAGLAVSVHRRDRRAWCRHGRNAAPATSGWWSRPRGTCSSATRRKHDAKAVDEHARGLQGLPGRRRARGLRPPLPTAARSSRSACWAHARRYFFKALGVRPRAGTPGADAHPGALHARARARDAPRPRSAWPRGKAWSQAASSTRFFAWCDEESLRALDETPIRRRMRYALNQRGRALALPRRRPAAHPQQLQRARAPPRGRRPQELALRRQRRRRRGQRHLRLAARELPAPRARALGLPARPLVPAPRLASKASPGARPRLLGQHCRLASGSRAPS